MVVLGQADPTSRRHHLPLFLSRISAGFPSPADDYVESRLSLDEHFVPRPEATFFLRVQGDSTVGAGIHDGDLLIVDKSLGTPARQHRDRRVHGELTVKRLYRKNGEISLLAENPAYRPIPVSEESQLVIWGVVTEVVHTALRQANVRLGRCEQFLRVLPSGVRTQA